MTNKILGVNTKNAFNFMHFLETRGVYDYTTLKNYQLANLFLEYQADYYDNNFSKAKTGQYTISASEMNEPFTMCAIASMAEVAETDQDYEAMRCIGAALQASVAGGANVYRAIALAIRCKERLELQEEIDEDKEIIDDVERVFNCGSTEGRLRQCEEFSPYHEVFEMLTELAKGREKHRQALANPQKYTSAIAADQAREALQDMLDNKQDEIRKLIAKFEAGKLDEMLKSKQLLLVEEQKYIKEQNMSEESFLAENNIELQGTTIGREMLRELTKEQAIAPQPIITQKKN